MDPLKEYFESINKEINDKYKNTNYTDSYIAFLDILGMKDLVQTEPYIFLRKLFNIIEEGKEIYSRVIVPKYKTFIGQGHLKYTVMSDSIVLSIDSSIDHALPKLIGISSYLIHKFVEMQPHPVFLRGGIAHGNVYHDDSTVFGPGLIEAYQLENDLANWMRCIISKSIYSEESFKEYIVSPTHALDKDPNDDLFFIKLRLYSNEELLNTYIEDVLKKSTDQRIIDKYQYLKKYINKK